jgi:hypothetical protein
MGVLSWLFPTDADRLAKAKRLMARGKWEDARRELVRCTLPEAEGLYDECSRAVDHAELAVTKRRARAQGFRGWKVEVKVADGKARAALEKLLTTELRASGVDLDSPELDEAAVKAALARTQKKARSRGISAVGSMRLVPVVASPSPPG